MTSGRVGVRYLGLLSLPPFTKLTPCNGIGICGYGVFVPALVNLFVDFSPFSVFAGPHLCLFRRLRLERAVFKCGFAISCIAKLTIFVPLLFRCSHLCRIAPSLDRSVNLHFQSPSSGSVLKSSSELGT